MLGLAAFLMVQPQPQSAAPARHPIITEVLYAVPTGGAGDANKDGTRDANGDEFIELVNTHDKPIQLAGYTIADREIEKNGKTITSMSFKFPACEVQPGQVVVVFNGHEQKWNGPVGNAAAAPTGGNAAFGGALVFTMEASTKQGLANKGDCVQLIAPDGEVAACIVWGDAPPPAKAKKVDKVPLVTKGSVERTSAEGAFAAAEKFTPGVWAGAKVEAKKEESKPDEKVPDKSGKDSKDKK